ncbi:MAG: tRNA-intron endonuclease [archaeon GW2011_AR20]|nr:MAG: tRNA-intron endonuclease [archaeon GW2011_AR20]MBS3160653.1 tRNA-intron lyase [Candidatus Woesearchaeota archaeon]
MAKKKSREVKEVKEEKEIKKFQINLVGDRLIAEDKHEAHNLYDQSRYGEIVDNKIQYSVVEGLYLLEKGRVDILNEKKKLKFDDFLKEAVKKEKNFWTRYVAYGDMRNRGYIVKTALKFGADFRIYDRGIKPGEDHAKWIMYPVRETDSLTWYEFSAKNRVAHSTRKKLLIAVVDEENDCTFYEIAWTRP